MFRKSMPLTALLTLCILSIAGCPFTTGTTGTTGDADPNDTTTTVVGNWSGTLTGTATKTIGDLAGTPRAVTRDLNISFNSNFIPTGLPIWGFDNAFDQTTVESAVGETENFEYNANFPSREITLVATIASATYTETTVNVVINLQYSSTNADQTLAEDGTGTMTITAAIDDTSLTLTGTAQYAVTQVTAQGTFETTEIITCSGTLTK